MKSKTYYKVVVAKDNGHYCSVVPTTELEYRVGKPTVPTIKNSKLFCFDSLRNAKSFLKDYNPEIFQIFSCKIKNPVKPPDKITVPSFHNIMCYWGNDVGTYRDKATPTGTVFCDEITLLDMVA